LLEDREVIRRCQCGQTDLIDILIDRYQVALYSLCMRLTRDRSQADDLFQETWIRVIRHLDQYSHQHSFATWLYSICLNRYRDTRRKQRRWLRRLVSFAGAPEHQTAVADTQAPEPGPEQLAIGSETGRAVTRAVQGLPDSHRLPILLHYFFDLSVEETSQALAVPPGTVKSRLYSGRQKLKALLEERCG
jgi:RNA polymerase sigma-70 factor (ECF subfamily)